MYIKLLDTEIFENYGKQTMPGEGEYDRPIGTNYTDKVQKIIKIQHLFFNSFNYSYQIEIYLIFLIITGRKT